LVRYKTLSLVTAKKFYKTGAGENLEALDNIEIKRVLSQSKVGVNQIYY